MPPRLDRLSMSMTGPTNMVYVYPVNIGTSNTDQGFKFETFQEEREPVQLKVSGSIPAYAAGTLYRVGPGGYQLDTDKGTTYSVSHLFDGFTQVHRFHIEAPTAKSQGVKVSYNSRHTVDNLIENIRKTGSLNGFSFGQKRDPCKSYFQKLQSVFFPAEGVPDDHKSSRNIGVTLSVNMPGLLAKADTNTKGDALSVSTLFLKTDASALAQIDPETLEPLGLA